MLKLLAPDVWCFDAEWIPDVAAGRRTYGLPAEMPDEEVRFRMWTEAGATPDNPRPYLKTALCRIVSIAAVKRTERDGKVSLKLSSIPSISGEHRTESYLLDAFLTSVGEVRPQLVGFNSVSADLPALMQRALVHRIAAPEFCRRPNKPWEGVDYFAKGSDHHVDLKELIGGWGRATPSLHEICSACRIPGKQSVDGGDVLELWLAGRVSEIVAYNQADALRTYLLFLRVAHLAGKITTHELVHEESLLVQLLAELPHLHDFRQAMLPNIDVAEVAA